MTMTSTYQRNGPIHIPGRGYQILTTAELSVQVHQFEHQHFPTQTSYHWQDRFPFLTRLEPRCQWCGESWPCEAGRFVQLHADEVQKFRRRYRNRHRAKGAARLDLREAGRMSGHIAVLTIVVFAVFIAASAVGGGGW